MKLKFNKKDLPKGKKVVSFGIEVTNGSIHDFKSFGEHQKVFEQKALSTKEWHRLDDKGHDIEDAEIVE
jgi:hypothetical protein